MHQLSLARKVNIYVSVDSAGESGKLDKDASVSVLFQLGVWLCYANFCAIIFL